MNRAELQEKLNALLVGESTYNIFHLADMVKNKIGEWFDNSKGYFNGVGVSGYTLRIRYKGRTLVLFDIKRKKIGDTFVVKEVVISDDFIDAETSIKEIEDKLKKTANDKREDDTIKNIWGCDIKELATMLTAIKKQFSNKNATELLKVISALEQNYWLIEEATEQC